MNKQYQYLVTAILTGIVIYLIYSITQKRKENYGDPSCTPNPGIQSNMSQNAAEACRQISSKAQEIEANAKLIAGTLQNLPFVSLFNPSNYKAGDTTSNNMMRNIINTDLSSCEVTDISNTCNNSVNSIQSNSIDTSNCPYCQLHGCDVNNVTQTNTANFQNQCTINAAIDKLTQKTNSVDAQAMAQVLQKANGLMSGKDQSTNDNCNIINTDMHTTDWLKAKTTCVNNIVSEQLNNIKNCGPVTNVVQANTLNTLQECVMGTNFKSTTKIASETKTLSEYVLSQLSEGLTTDGIIAMICVCVLCCCCSAGAAFMLNEANSN